ncbi:hypothetical protein GDO78_021297 [Eleutherodactylus coqui]|uniref:Uncharacterized protein n=1 Tax=Eleutherodactylus coqui TaxID=57060 RepID=A0A8J6B5S3_ELECQ|nr:hypothetical protein GDO78_021297 [Eleutherodactylus coqui]
MSPPPLICSTVDTIWSEEVFRSLQSPFLYNHFHYFTQRPDFFGIGAVQHRQPYTRSTISSALGRHFYASSQLFYQSMADKREPLTP